MGRIVASAIAGLILAGGMLVGTWAIYMLVRGMRGLGESPGVYGMIGALSLIPALLLIAVAAIILYAAVSPGRGSQRGS